MPATANIINLSIIFLLLELFIFNLVKKNLENTISFPVSKASFFINKKMFKPKVVNLRSGRNLFIRRNVLTRHEAKF